MAPRPGRGHHAGAADPAAGPARRGRGLPVRTVDPFGRALGFLSVAAAAVLGGAPGAVVRRVGLADSAGARLITRAVAARQLGTGVGVLASRRPTGWLWGRVAGDGVDLALLGLGAVVQAQSAPAGLRWPWRRVRRWSRSTAVAASLLAAVSVADVVAAIRLTRSRGPHRTASGSIVVERPPDDVYGRWRELQDDPRFLSHLDLRRARGAAGPIPSGRADAVRREVPGELIEWRSSIASDVDHAGTARFEPLAGGRSTLVTVRVDFRPPGGLLGSLVAGLFGEHPRQQIADDLVRFKRLMEGTDGDEPVGPGA